MQAGCLTALPVCAVPCWERSSTTLIKVGCLLNQAQALLNNNPTTQNLRCSNVHAKRYFPPKNHLFCSCARKLAHQQRATADLRSLENLYYTNPQKCLHFPERSVQSVKVASGTFCRQKCCLQLLLFMQHFQFHRAITLQEHITQGAGKGRK